MPCFAVAAVFGGEQNGLNQMYYFRVFNSEIISKKQEEVRSVERSKKRVLVAMSGGVDSSVAAYLLREQGYECVGVTMKLFGGEAAGLDRGHPCCTLDDVEDARDAARRMGIPHYVFNFSREFEEKVIQPFVDAYERGDTPNPCVGCNRFLKFDKLYRRALELGCEYIATGHYARIVEDGAGGFRMTRAADRGRDQSYVLYPIPRERLGRTLFPLGGLTKGEVRQIAEREGFVNARKHDSQDICFVPDGDYLAFMERYTGKTYPAGDILDRDGRVVGRHRGAAGLTIGQRRGVGVSSSGRIYVCGKCMADNTVTVGPEEALYSGQCVAADWNWLIDPPPEPFRALAKTRYRQTEQPTTVVPEGNRVRLRFDRPQRAVTTGQAAVVYDETGVVLGGGTIVEVLK